MWDYVAQSGRRKTEVVVAYFKRRGKIMRGQ
jgi:hypothetical protein